MEKKTGFMLAAVAAGAYMLTRKGSPTFYDMNGQSISAITCGGSISFNVPGYSRVWLSQLKNGTLAYDGPFDLPMPAYIVNCANDIGTYDVAVYEIGADDMKGKLIGQTKFDVLPQQ
jgi:hypothetical protein